MPTAYQGSREENQALECFIKLMRASESVAARIHSERSTAAEETLTVSQFGVLEALYHLGPLCQKELGRKLLKSGGNITTVIDNLEKRQLVERRRRQNDRRYLQVHLTDRGRTLIAYIFPRHVRHLVQAFSCLSAPEQQQLAALCRKLGRQQAPGTGEEVPG